MNKNILFTVRLLLLIISISLSVTSCKSHIEPVALQTIHVQVMWVPNAQFAGYYVAMEKGFYQDVGLEVIINPYNEHTSVRDAMMEGKAEFGIDGAFEVLLGCGEKQPLKAIFVDYRIDPTAFASLKSKQITHPEDWVGKKIGILPDSTGSVFRAIAMGYNIDVNQMTFKEYNYDFSMLTEGEVDVIPIYIFDEPYVLEKMGYQIDTILAYDYGIKSYGDTLFTTENFITENPEIVRNFVQATAKGWQFALEHQEETLDIVLRYDDEGYHDREYERYILVNESPLVHTGEDKIGWMREEVWQDMNEILITNKMIDHPIDISNCYTNAFLDQE
jgi:NitT/TauT family transport system substrate-binding protein